jgi:2-polyprenyl-6-methoxyphenol hydroxylase-like FAD-dependent oxidoreductase
MFRLLLARAGLRTTVVEKHLDFFHDFRGDTVHPSTLDVMTELGFLEEFLALPHQKARTLHTEINGQPATIADYSRLPTHCRDIAFMPQWDFLSLLARKASAYSNFHLMMGYEETGLLEEDGRSTGVRLCDKDGNVSALKADLTICADGRKSVVRREAHLDIQDLGSPVDVL